MNTSEFQILSVLAKEKNMRKASERLFVSQPALSQRLQSIEKNWNTKIFIRTQKGLLITPAGEKIVEFAEEVLAKEAKVREEITSLDKEIYGTLKIAVATIIGQYWLPKVLKRYIQKYPNAKVSLVTGWSSDIVKSLYEDEVHLGIIRGNPEWKGVKKHLLRDKLYLVDTEIKELSELELTERPFIQFKSDSTYYQEIQVWWHKKFQAPPKRTIVVDQIETCKQMALNGIGYAILPSITLQDDYDNIKKIPLEEDEVSNLHRDTWLIGYESSFNLKQVEAFLEVLEEYEHGGK
ncbi:LysR family transcriptional regulator [Sutcliffiella horikoshii]|uniref:LysR family transcriptional regulator n=1 Tax=Sutcliffiella horikoshii TaxID=79883 RepID=A0A1Y0CLI1_9BACI|nr:LysR family transcriptional regulator [Sutcliffiella horikoshii]ART76163.1 LysR family transcriptional regulator [Sutcliffiella horikoshii]TYS68559.1 LysR family transcriptional regulator [Sutcliffiella horikoshii]